MQGDLSRENKGILNRRSEAEMSCLPSAFTRAILKHAVIKILFDPPAFNWTLNYFIAHRVSPNASLIVVVALGGRHRLRQRKDSISLVFDCVCPVSTHGNRI